ncbi:MAG: sigma-54-dependent Fis family transcriptional regulator [candidate division Zixibacteria bacterium]|nr:sigma-54-dependent Fis family transcriptional regulator [candidate division Zixibacteria bacterium]
MNTISTMIVVKDNQIADIISKAAGELNHSLRRANSEADVSREMTYGRHELVFISSDITDDLSSLISSIKRSAFQPAVILISDDDSSVQTVEGLRSGADDLLIAPATVDRVRILIERALENRRMRQDLINLRSRMAWQYGLDNIVGNSLAMRTLKESLTHLAKTELTVLITGESGAGKGLIANVIHQRSNRRRMPMITVNCSAIPSRMLGSEIFGSQNSSAEGYTNAIPGKLEEANGGTLLLNNISKLPMDVQSRLLTVIGEIKNVSDGNRAKLDVRILTTSNQNLSSSGFNQELLTALSGFRVAIPALRDRAEDIPLLVERLLRENEYDSGKSETTSNLWTSAKAMEKLITYSWPENVRELKSVIKRASDLVRGDEIQAEEIIFTSKFASSGTIGIGRNIESADFGSGSLETTYRNRILKSLEENDWNFTQTANELGIGRTTLWRKVKKFNLRREVISM